jgi:CHAT domain-containing protein/Tfp pilus assembly protein PilF
MLTEPQEQTRVPNPVVAYNLSKNGFFIVNQVQQGRDMTTNLAIKRPIEAPCSPAKAGLRIFNCKDVYHFEIRSLTLQSRQGGTGNALALAVQIRYHYHSFLSCGKFLQMLVFSVLAAISFSMFSVGCTVSHYEPDIGLSTSEISPGSSGVKEYMLQGMEFFRRGDFENAIAYWRHAAEQSQREGKVNQHIESLVKLSQAHQSIGQYENTLQNLRFALVLAEKSGNQKQIASILGYLGNTYIAVGRTDEAYEYLKQGLDLAEELQNPAPSAVILNNLGNLFTLQEKYEKGIDAYQQAWVLSKKASNYLLLGIALTNAAIASIHKGEYEKARSLLDKSLYQLRDLPDSHDKAYALINVGLAYDDLRPHLSDPKGSLSILALESLNEATMVAEGIGDLRAMSYARGYIGHFYEKKECYQEALESTREATFAAQLANSPESLYRWQWQAGRLLKATGRMDEAISGYRRAVETLQSIRQEVSVAYGRKESSFRDNIGPLYFELVDLLLQRAASEKERKDYEPFLIEAREKVELLKAAELQDYFQDECVVAAQARVTSLDVVSQTAVVIYPIILPDRTELLVSLPEGLKRFSIPVGADDLTREVRQFRRRLEKRTSWEYIAHAQQLYDWLIRPLEADLAQSKVHTLVFVPDGPLRTIPMAALHDGKQYFVEKFALAITPGLNLTDPRPINREGIRILAVGITESSQGFPPLPYVIEELDAIQGVYGGKLLLNQEFLLSKVEEALLKEPFNIVHIASHAEFNSDIDKTFLLTFDAKLTLERLDQCVGFFRFREDPLELLTLSACETAAGDDRAALGLAGVAVKAGARSAFATLWHINDQASSLLVSEFYRQLQDPSVSRAVALQRAQLELIGDWRYEHSGYWSPFILINNWL